MEMQFRFSSSIKILQTCADSNYMDNVFLHHIYVMYSLWFAAGVMLLAYIAYRRKRISNGQSVIAATKNDPSAAH